MDLIPLGSYQPETLSFRVHGDQSLCVDVAKNAMLYSNKLDHLLAKDYLNSPYLVEYAFFLLDSVLLIGPRQPVKKAHYYKCQFNAQARNGFEIIECIRHLSPEQVFNLKMLRPEGVTFSDPVMTRFVIRCFSGGYYLVNMDAEESGKYHAIESAGEVILYHRDRPWNGWQFDLKAEGARLTGRPIRLPSGAYSCIQYYTLSLREHGVFRIAQRVLKKGVLERNPGLKERIEAAQKNTAGNEIMIFDMEKPEDGRVYVIKGNPALVLRATIEGEENRVLAVGVVERPFLEDRVCFGLQLFLSGVLVNNLALQQDAKDKVVFTAKRGKVTDQASVEAVARSRYLLNREALAISAVKEKSGMMVNGQFRVAVTQKSTTSAHPSVSSPTGAGGVHPFNQQLVIHSYSELQGGGCRVDVKWTYGHSQEQIRYWVPAQPVEDFQIISELVALRDVLLVRTVTKGVPLTVGAEDIVLTVSKGAIKRMIRSDSVKLKTGWDSARYLMARCYGGKIEVEKKTPLAEDHALPMEVISLALKAEDEMLDSPLGLVRLSHHAIKRIMERRVKACQNTWAFAVEALKNAKIKGKSNAFKHLKHDKQAQYVVGSGWRFVVSHEQGDPFGRVVFTAYPALSKTEA